MARGAAGERRMILGLGNDLCDIRRIEQTLERFGDRFLDRVFTEAERKRAFAKARPGRHARQALRRQGSLRQGARAPAFAPARSGATWASSTCPPAGRP